jgi:hypothetical protein
MAASYMVSARPEASEAMINQGYLSNQEYLWNGALCWMARKAATYHLLLDQDKPGITDIDATCPAILQSANKSAEHLHVSDSYSSHLNALHGSSQSLLITSLWDVNMITLDDWVRKWGIPSHDYRVNKFQSWHSNPVS